MAAVCLTFIDYLNAVQDAKLEQGEYLTFDEYSQTGLAELNRPYQVKYVLEDNKLALRNPLEIHRGSRCQH